MILTTPKKSIHIPNVKINNRMLRMMENESKLSILIFLNLKCHMKSGHFSLSKSEATPPKKLVRKSIAHSKCFIRILRLPLITDYPNSSHTTNSSTNSITPAQRPPHLIHKARFSTRTFPSQK